MELPKWRTIYLLFELLIFMTQTLIGNSKNGIKKVVDLKVAVPILCARCLVGRSIIIKHLAPSTCTLLNTCSTSSADSKYLSKFTQPHLAAKYSSAKVDGAQTAAHTSSHNGCWETTCTDPSGAN